jgi:hypothetical protein
VVTIRDKQLEENKRLEQEWLEEQKKLDLMMEIERLKGAQVIVDQIQERTVQRMKEQEIRDKERLELLSNIEKARQAEKAALRAK